MENIWWKVWNGGPFSMSYFEMIMSKHGARIVWFQENSFINEYLISNHLSILVFVFLSPLVRNKIRVSTIFWANFGLMTLPHLVKASKFWENGVVNEYFTSKHLFFLIFIVLSTLMHEQNLDHFDSFLGWWRHHR